MSPSSLIFVAVVVSWIAYLVIHVARRREQLATARNVDRFSTQMRVLQRRAVANAAVQTPGRVTSTSLGVEQPLVARTPGLPVEGHTLIQAPEASPGTSVSAALVAHSLDEGACVRRQRARAGLLLVSVATSIITCVFTFLGVVSWIVPVLALAVAVFTAARMRAAALTRRAARERAAAMRRRERAAAKRDQVVARHERRPSAHAMPVAQEFAPPRSEPQFFDVAALEPEPVTTRAEVDRLFTEGGWQPVPVPPPTYTLKAKAYRPLPPPAATTPAPVPVDDEAGETTWNEERGGSRSVGA